MTRLTDTEIKKLLTDLPNTIFPTPKTESISGITCDIHLGHEFTIFENDDINSPKKLTYEDSDTFILRPGKFALACTFESVDIPSDIVAWLDGRSSLARLGLFVHVSAHRIDPSFKGQIVLELFNAGPSLVKIKPNTKIGALSFEKLNMPVEIPYSKRLDAKYCDQNGAVTSKLAKD